MPQMMPMLWMIMFCVTMFMLFLIIIFLYFFYTPRPLLTCPLSKNIYWTWTW
uniref:ATP synthase F0 subunit 8 n=1 Tax=Pheidole flavens TaxID=458933 RepID=A0A2U8XCA1_9HYME|nr:ATP synthase F0 subunit 8 [Pheidole flavens]